MASIQKHGDKWRVFFYRDGIRKSKVCRTKTEAKLWAEQLGAEMAANGYGSKTVTLHTALRRYADEIAPQHKGARWEVVRINKFLRELKDIRLADLKPSDLAEWRDSKTIAPGSVLREMKLLNQILEQCRKEWGYITKNPLSDVSRPTAPAPRRRGVTQAEIDAVCEGLDYTSDGPVIEKRQQVAVAFLLAIETAMRKGEMLGLVPERIHLDKRFVQLPETKNGDSRQVPLSTRAVELLRSLPAGCFTVSAASADVMFRRVAPEGVHFHDSRSEGITRLAKKLSVLDLSRVVGHRDPRSLMIYYRETAEEIALKLD